MKKIFRNLFVGAFVFVSSCATVFACETCEQQKLVYLSAQDYNDVHVNGNLSEVALYNLDYTSVGLKGKLKEQIQTDHESYHSEFLQSGMSKHMSPDQIIDVYKEFLPQIDEISTESSQSNQTGMKPGEVIEIDFTEGQNPYAQSFEPFTQREGFASYLLDYKYDNESYEEYFKQTITSQFKDIGSMIKVHVQDDIYAIGTINKNHTATILVCYSDETQMPIQMELSLDPSEFNTVNFYNSVLAFNDYVVESDGSYSYVDSETGRQMNIIMDDDQYLILTFFKR